MDNVAADAVSRINDPVMLFCLAILAIIAFVALVIFKYNKDERKAETNAKLTLAKALTGLQTVLDQKALASPKMDVKLDRVLETQQETKTLLVEIKAKLD